MSHYSTRFRTRLQTADVALQQIFSEVDPRYPHTILEGKRTPLQQQANVDKGVSKTMESMHLEDPSEAIDAAPDPLKWPNVKQLVREIADLLSTHVPREQRGKLNALISRHVKDVGRWYHFGGYVQGTADQMYRHGEVERKVRWGGDWDSDRVFSDQNFDDLAHFELS